VGVYITAVRLQLKTVW